MIGWRAEKLSYMNTLDRIVIVEQLALDQGLWKQILARVGNDTNLAEDVLQQVLIKVYEKIHQLKDATRLYAWVYQIMKNEAAKLYWEQLSTVDFDCDEIEAEYEMQASETGETVEQNELEQVLCDCLEQDLFTETEQAVAELLVHETLQGMDHLAISKNIRERFGYNSNYTKTLLSRIRKKIDDYLQRHGFLTHLKHNTRVERKEVAPMAW